VGQQATHYGAACAHALPQTRSRLASKLDNAPAVLPTTLPRAAPPGILCALPGIKPACRAFTATAYHTRCTNTLQRTRACRHHYPSTLLCLLSASYRSPASSSASFNLPPLTLLSNWTEDRAYCMTFSRCLPSDHGRTDRQAAGHPSITYAAHFLLRLRLPFATPALSAWSMATLAFHSAPTLLTLAFTSPAHCLPALRLLAAAAHLPTPASTPHALHHLQAYLTTTALYQRERRAPPYRDACAPPACRHSFIPGQHIWRCGNYPGGMPQVSGGLQASQTRTHTGAHARTPCTFAHPHACLPTTPPAPATPPHTFRQTSYYAACHHLFPYTLCHALMLPFHRPVGGLHACSSSTNC